MNKNFEKIERIVDRLEEYSRRNRLLLHGIPEDERENTDDLVLGTLNEKVHGDLTLSDLDKTHLTCQKNAASNKPKAVIDKCVSCNVSKRTFFFSIKAFKRNTSYYYRKRNSQGNENFKGGKGKTPFCNVWTTDGKILYKDGNNNS